MSKLARHQKNGVDGKAKKRHDSRIKQFENSDGKTRHQHHKPGSMNMKKSGR